MFVDQTRQTVQLPQAQIQLAKLPFLIDGDFGPNKSALDIQAVKVSLQQLVQTLSPAHFKELQRIKAAGEVSFQLHYQSAIDRQNPVVEAYFGLQNGSLTEPQFGSRISGFECFGTYKNVPIDEVRVERFSFQTRGSKFTGQLQLTDFAAPVLRFNTKGKVPLALVHALYPIAEIETVNGAANLQASGVFHQTTSLEWQAISLKGKAQIKAPRLKLNALQKPFNAVNCTVQFNKADLNLQQFQAHIGQSDFELHALFPGIFKSKRVNEQQLIEGAIEARHMAISDFQTKTGAAPTAWILPSDLQVDLLFQIQELQWEQKRVENLAGKLHLNNRKIQFNSVQFRHAAGSWNGDCTLLELSPEYFKIAACGTVKQLEVSAFLKQWDNFDQEVITYEQLSGFGALDFNIQTNYGLSNGLEENSLKARIFCRLQNGRLYHAPLLQELAGTLTYGKGRPILGAKNQAALQQKLQDVHFETLQNTFVISDRQLHFSKMRLASSALDIDLVGKHSFDHQIDYALGLRFRDLLIQETQTEFGEIIDDGTGVHLFVRISGTLDDPKVSWDQNGKKAYSKQKLAQSNQESKEMLKSTFGLYQNDLSVGTYEPSTAPHETIKVKFTTQVASEKKSEAPSKSAVQSTKTENKSAKLKEKLEKWKAAQEKNEMVQIQIKIKG